MNSSIYCLPITKAQGPDCFTGEFNKTLKEEMISILQSVSENRSKGNTS